MRKCSAKVATIVECWSSKCDYFGGEGGKPRTHQTYRMRLIRRSREVHHAIEACKGGTIALVAMSVELLLCEDVSTALEGRSKHLMHLQGRGLLVGSG